MFPFGNNSIIEPSKYFKNGLFLILVEISIQTKTEKKHISHKAYLENM